MTSHRFACGEDVILKAGYTSHVTPGLIFTIESLLPLEATAPRYRVKAAHERFSRVVREEAIAVPPISEPAAGALDGRARRGDRPGGARAAAEALFIRRVPR